MNACFACHHWTRLAVVLGLAWWLAACAATSPAWVEDRSLHSGKTSSRKSSYRKTVRRPARYTVRKGDTLYSIAFRYGLRFQDLARWNGIRKPYVIYPGQHLRLKPGGKTTKKTASAKHSKPAVTLSTNRTVTSSTGNKSGGSRKPVKKPRGVQNVKVWRWPLRGRLLSSFKAGDPARQGINIAVKAGTPVRAAAGGKVVYSGNGLRGFGELVIIKHNDRWLTAYGHNRKRKVKEGQTVQAGQVIAEAGNSEAPQVMLHFEIRKDGKPVDPLKYLP